MVHCQLIIPISLQRFPISVSEFVQKAKSRSSYTIQQEFTEIKKKYYGQYFWARGFFSTTSGHIAAEMINDTLTTTPTNNMSLSVNFRRLTAVNTL